ncbi:MAG: hypothetical protein A2070_08595 [Bdellovibrionales bacterium GWC1_52_8]|nr:MAG: hypothetical protein A2X97_01450 [Bdellovibrionales bacterium GWA1_52_35]OFZ40254.1 MAG: hypothetical protein A2070_08595 [Bdellovibrionales bacterium GWC1_52_8]
MLKRVATYLDSNAGAPLQPCVVDALLPFLSESDRTLIPNPSSIHSFGRNARRCLSTARQQIAGSLGPKIDPEQVIFTSGGTESNQLAVQGFLGTFLEAGVRPHWITTPVEHDSVLQIVSWFQKRGGRVSFLPVDFNGAPVVSALESLWNEQTKLVSVIWANNETGVVSDVEALSQEVVRLGGVLHLDAAQAWGKLPIDLSRLGADMVSFSGHKIGGLAGSGALWVKPGLKLDSLIAGKQEKGRRGGTENLLGIISMGAAASTLDLAAVESWASSLEPLRDRLQNAICERIPRVIVHGASGRRVANTLNLSFEGVASDGLVMALDLSGYAVSSGAACASGAMEPSHVLLAMGRSPGEAIGAIRISLPREVNWPVLSDFVDELEKIVNRIRVPSGHPEVL